MPGEITQEHLSRKAIVYVRQSSLNQVRNNIESQQLQYNLVHRAHRLGWAKQDILVLDHDLGVTATGVKKRHGFDELICHICSGDTGGIFVLNCSRIARNGREWNQVLEVCPVFKTIIIDHDGIYDPNIPSDRFWLGMKGSMSEYEVNQLRTLARAAILNKAQRGELIHNLPAGLQATEADQIELAPDQRIQQAIHTVFAKFDELGSINQVAKWYQRENIEVPVREYKGGVGITWRVPSYSTLNNILTNPFYAGIYMYPRTKTKTKIVEGRIVKTRGHRVTLEDNPILLNDLFVGYIDSEKFYQNQEIIANNANMNGRTAKGPSREGTSLLAGLIRCGHCSRKMRVHYSASNATPSYYCPKHLKVADAKSCLRFNARALEEFVSRQILVALEPVAIETALQAEETFNQTIRQKSDSLSYALSQARYEVERIERQFNAADPENYLVSKTLASRWQKALEKEEKLQSEYDQVLAELKPLTEDERTRLFELAKDMEALWDHPQTDFKIRTRLVRLLIKEVLVQAGDPPFVKAMIHWHGGVHTEFSFKRTRAGQKRDDIKEHPLELIKKLAPICHDRQIARILNRAGVRTKDNQSWSELKVSAYRTQNKISAFSQDQYDRRAIVTLEKAASILGLSLASVLELIKCGVIKGKQAIKYAPWEIKRTELEERAVLHVVAAMKKGQPIPFHQNQATLNL